MAAGFPSSFYYYPLQAGETGVALQVFINPQPPTAMAANPIDATTALTATFRIQPPAAAIYSVSGTTGTIGDPYNVGKTANGSYAQYVTTGSDFATVGLYNLQLILTFTGNITRKIPLFPLTVGPSL